jgi:membrane protein
MGLSARMDAFQRRHQAAGIAIAVAYKFFDDQGTYLVALLTYYAFLSLFPLLLLLVSALGALLQNNPELQERVLHSVLSKFPVIGEQLGHNIHSFRSNGFALGAGVVVSLYGALGVAQAAQLTLNKIWGVPRYRRSDPLRSRLKGMLFLGLVAAGLAATTGLSIAASASRVFGSHLGVEVRFAVTVAAIALNALVLLLTYRMLTHREIPARRLLGASIGAACAWQGLQWAGTYYVSNVLRGASATYGMFGIVLGLVAWMYLAALVFVVAAEVSAVRLHRLWPRSLMTPFTDDVRLTWADRRAYESYATTEQHKSFEEIKVYFHQERPPPDDTENS